MFPTRWGVFRVRSLDATKLNVNTRPYVYIVVRRVMMTKSCTNNQHCVNYQGDHPAYPKDCLKWISEKDVQKVKSTRNIYICGGQKGDHCFPTYLNRTNICKQTQNYNMLQWDTNNSLSFHPDDNMQIDTAPQILIQAQKLLQHIKAELHYKNKLNQKLHHTLKWLSKETLLTTEIITKQTCR